MEKEKFWICFKKKTGAHYLSVYKGWWNNFSEAASFLKRIEPAWKRKLYAICNSDKTEILYQEE